MPKASSYGKSSQHMRSQLKETDLQLDAVRAVQEQIPSGYKQSLKTARDRNRKRLQRSPSPESAERQRIEQGFTLYFRGANQDRRQESKPSVNNRGVESRGYPKTSGGERNQERNESGHWRAKTAPEEQEALTNRRRWDRPSELRLCGSDRRDGLMSEYYSDDFDDENDYTDSSFSDDDESYDLRSTKDKLLLSIDDVKSLRMSLSIMESKSKKVRETIDMKDIVEEIADEIIHDSSCDGKAEKNLGMVVLELQPHQRQTKEVGLTYRKKPDSPPRPLNVASVVSAMEAENNRVVSQDSASGDSRKPRANLQVEKPVDLRSSTQRLQFLIERVMQLSQTQQKQLASALADVESATSLGQGGETAVEKSVEAQNERVKADSRESDSKTVRLELLSNWGHPSKIGLTEVEIFNDKKEYIDDVEILLVTYDGKRLSGKDIPDLTNLTNRRKKTTKERFMWSTSFNPAVSGHIELLFLLPPSVKSVSKVVIWNHNQTLKNLDIGVRECRVFIDDQLLFDDEVEKGCGNQVFDYGTVIALPGQTPSPDKQAEPIPAEPASDEDDLCSAASMHRSLEEQLRSPREAAPLTPREAGQSTPRDAGRSTPREAAPLTPRDAGRSTPREAAQSTPKSARSDRKADCRTPKVERKPAPLSCSTDDDDCLLNQLQEYKKTKKKPAPHWLKQQAPGTPTKKEEDPLLLTGWPNRVAGRPHLDTELDRASPESAKNARYGRRSQAGSRGGSRPTSRQTPDSDSDRDSGRETPMQKLLNAREKRRKTMSELEQSWSSLNFFDKFHAGRISTDVQDVLDECLKKREKVDKVEEVEEEASVSPVPEEEDEEDSVWSDDEFCIPELPTGTELTVNIRSTWGDRHYVGLSGIEAFSASGEPCQVSSISAEPCDINVLPGYGSDPRVVANLIDGVNRTRDDTHMWLAPFTAGQNHLVKLTFARAYRVALLRIWNYNKSRIHSSRGACDVEVTLDGKFVFKGEICRSSGTVANERGETILFTTDEGILERVAAHDEALSEDEDQEEVEDARPSTSDTGVSPDTARPFTCAQRQQKAKGKPAEKVASLRFEFTATWGDLHYLGLTGLELIDLDGETIPIDFAHIHADPADLRQLPGCEGDARTLDKLVNGNNHTADDTDMWLVPFCEGEVVRLDVDLPQPRTVAGFRLWNYNKSVEDAHRGARAVHVFADERRVSPDDGFVLRRAPGHTGFEFGQEVLFADAEKHGRGEDGVPCGFVFRLDLRAAWGDPYYLGLTGIELLGADSRPVPVSDRNVIALPHSVNALPGMYNDVRTPDKLVDGVNDGDDPRHSWLAPILPDIPNTLLFIFDFPVAVAAIRLWNYAKTPARGVRDFSILVDDLLLFSGTLPPVSAVRGVLPTAPAPQRHHAVILAERSEVAKREPRGCVLNQASNDGQDVKLTNDRQVVANYAKAPTRAPDQQLRPKTSVTKQR